MRLFVALELPEVVRAALRALVGQLQRSRADVRWVCPEGMHLTLKFIGEVEKEQVGSIQEALAALSSPEPARLSFRGLGYFPNGRRPRVLWVGIHASENLAALAAAVEEAFVPLGIPAEKRAYRPHLTLGRFKSGKRLPQLQAEIAALPSTDFGEMEASAFHLYQSQLSPAGAHYTQLAAFPFVRG